MGKCIDCVNRWPECHGNFAVPCEYSIKDVEVVGCSKKFKCKDIKSCNNCACYEYAHTNLQPCAGCSSGTNGRYENWISITKASTNVLAQAVDTINNCITSINMQVLDDRYPPIKMIPLTEEQVKEGKSNIYKLMEKQNIESEHKYTKGGAPKPFKCLHCGRFFEVPMRHRCGRTVWSRGARDMVHYKYVKPEYGKD
jgi:hypothetical protein